MIRGEVEPGSSAPTLDTTQKWAVKNMDLDKQALLASKREKT